MIRLAVSVEGNTEEGFVRKSLAPHLQPYDVYPQPVLIGRAIFFRKVNCLGTIWTQITDVIQHDAYDYSILEAISCGGLLFTETNYGLEVSHNLATLR